MKSWHKRFNRWAFGLAFSSWVFVLASILIVVYLPQPLREWSREFGPRVLLATQILAALSLVCALISAVFWLADRIRRRRREEESEFSAFISGFSFPIAVLTFILLVIVLPALGRTYPEVRNKKCDNNLKQLGIVFQMFCEENPGGQFPELSPSPGRLIFANQAPGFQPVCPEYMSELEILVCPESKHKKPEWPEKLTESSAGHWIRQTSDYLYIGYVLENEAQAKVFVDAYNDQIKKGAHFDKDLSVPGGAGNHGSNVLHRLKKNVFDLWPSQTDPLQRAKWESEVPVIVERRGNHQEGANVLFLDGHVELLKDWNKFPLTMAVILGRLETGATDYER